MYPRININVEGIYENTLALCKKCSMYDIDVTGITKAFLADHTIAEAMIRGGVKSLGDSRIDNLKKLDIFNIEKWLIRIPMECEIEDVVKYADVSLNSELKTVKKLNKAAYKADKTHKVILMVDLGDLREGYFSTDDLFSDIDAILSMKNIKLYGIGTNLTCYGGIIPRPETISKLVKIKDRIEEMYDIDLKIISGGNSSTYTLIESGEMIPGINNLRLGESILLGRETSYGKRIEGIHHSNFTIEAQIVELKEKPSMPIGEIGMDSFGNVPEFTNKGIMKRAICAIGKQDVDISGLRPIDNNIDILGGSSDHLLLDLTETKKEYKLGDVIKFKINYSVLLSAMTSEFVKKNYI